MLETLSFVRGAVAKKDFIPALTHFHIKNGIIQSANGVMTLSSPIDIDLEASPRAVDFIRVIKTCKKETSLHLTKAGRLAVKSGRFKAFVPCAETEYPHVQPKGVHYTVPETFLETIKVLAPFMAEDASRPWANGMLFKDRSVFVTNNVLLVQKWLDIPFPVTANIPKAAIKELIRIKENPQTLQLDESKLTLHFAGGRWLQTSLNKLEWPDLEAVLNRESNQVTIDNRLQEIVQEIAPFVDEMGRVYFHDNTVTTTKEEEEGVLFENENAHHTGCYHFKQLEHMLTVAKTIDLTCYPKPSIFYGEKLRGAIIGLRDVTL